MSRVILIPALMAALVGADPGGQSSARAAALFGSSCPGPGLVSAPDRVDFSLPPLPGLRFRVKESGTYRVKGTVVVEGETPRNIVQNLDAALSLEQHILAVENGKISRLERRYEKFCLDVHHVESMEGEKTKDQKKKLEHPLAGKHISASWKDGFLTLQTREKDVWKPMEPGLRKRLSTRKLIHPIFLLPDSVKKIGESWDLDPEALKDYLSNSFTDQRDPAIEGVGQVTFTGFETHKGETCALLRFQFKLKAILPRHPGFAFTMKGSCHYNLRHRILVALKASGSMSTKGTMEQDDSLVTLDLKGTIQTHSEAEVLVKGQESSPEN